MTDRMPVRGEVWIKRKTGERYDVWGVDIWSETSPRWVTIYPQRPGNRRPLDVGINNFFQEYVPAEDHRG